MATCKVSRGQAQARLSPGTTAQSSLPPIMNLGRFWSDSDWATCKNDRKSVAGYLGFVGMQLVVWQSCKQKTQATSSTEAEYVGNANAAKEGRYVANLLKEIFGQLKGSVFDSFTLYTDNQGAIYLASNEVTSQKAKHIDIVYHMIRDWLKKAMLVITYCPTDENPADMMTKSLGKVKLVKFRAMAGVT